MSGYKEFLAEYKRLAGLNEAPEDRAFNPETSTGGARFLPGRAARARIENPPDPRLQAQFGRALADVIPGVGAAASLYDAYKSGVQGDYAGAVGNIGTAAAQTFVPGGLMSAGKAVVAPFAKQAAKVGSTPVARVANGITNAQRAATAAGTAGLATSVLAPAMSTQSDGDAGEAEARAAETARQRNIRLAGSTQSDGDAGEAEARAAETARQRNIRLAGSTQSDGDAGEAEARSRNQADQALERSRQAQADISTGGYSGGRSDNSEILGGLESGEFTQRMQPGGTGVTPGAGGQGLRYPPGTTFSPQIKQGTIPPQVAAPAAPPPQMYEIGKGDTLSQIAAKSGTSVAALMAANPQITNPDRISVGQKINVTGLPSASTYAGGVGTVSDTQAKIKAGIYTPDVISTQAAQRAAVSPYGMPNAPGSGPAQMMGRMVPGTTSAPTSAITTGVNQAISNRPESSNISPAPLNANEFSNFITNKNVAKPVDDQQTSIGTASPVIPVSKPATDTGSVGYTTNINQAGFDAAQARADRKAAELKAQRDASPEWQNAPTVTTTNPDGSTTRTKEASWTTPPNPNTAALNTTTGNKDNFQESISKIKLLAGLRV